MSNQQSTSLAKPPAPAPLSGTLSDAQRVDARLREAESKFHLVSPATRCGSLPEGCEVAFSVVTVDLQNETYDVGGGKRALSKSALERIAAAAGVSWIPSQCRRLDDASDPRYVAFCAVGTVRQFDGSVLTISGNREVDLRDGSPQVEALIAKAKAKNRDPASQIREMRLHILARAESFAKLRAIRSLGIRSSYAPPELAKPFVSARLTFTGKTDDRDLAKSFAIMRAESFLNSSRSLYGDAPAPAPAAPPMRLSPPTPPPARAPRVEADVDEDLELDELPPEPGPPPAELPPPAAAAAPAPAQGAPPPPPTAPEAFVIPSGPEQGKLLADASDAALSHFLARVEGAIEAGVVQDSTRATAFVKAVRAEMGERATGQRDAEGR